MPRLLRSRPPSPFYSRPIHRRQGITQTITMSGIASAEAFGSHTINSGLLLVPVGIASEEAFGTFSLVTDVAPTGIPSSEAFGTPTLKQKIVFSSIVSGEAFGTAALQTLFAVRPTSIASSETFGATTVSQDIGIRYPLHISIDDSQTRVLVDFR